MTGEDQRSQEAMLPAAERLVHLGEQRYDTPSLCRRAGVPQEVADSLWRALGFPDVPEDERAFTEEDARALAVATEGLEKLDSGRRAEALKVLIREARRISAHLANVAEIEVDTLAELRALGLREGAIHQAFESGLERSELGWLFLYALRRQLAAAVRRIVLTEGDATVARPTLAVGFVDLVNFTTVTGGIEVDELSTLLSRFESLAADIVTEAGGRTVKMIGDEAMFVHREPAQAVTTALAIVEHCGEKLPPARSGLAFGQLLRQAGDYFGPVVNVASRIVDKASAGTVLVEGALSSQLQGNPAVRLEALAPQRLKGVGEARLWRVRRS